MTKRALDEAAAMGRAVRRCTPVTFLPSADRRPLLYRLIRRYGYTAFCTLCIGAGLVACAYVLIALSVMP